VFIYLAAGKANCDNAQISAILEELGLDSGRVHFELKLLNWLLSLEETRMPEFCRTTLQAKSLDRGTCKI
jgi:hypothetical protein